MSIPHIWSYNNSEIITCPLPCCPGEVRRTFNEVSRILASVNQGELPRFMWSGESTRIHSRWEKLNTHFILTIQARVVTWQRFCTQYMLTSHSLHSWNPSLVKCSALYMAGGPGADRSSKAAGGLSDEMSLSTFSTFLNSSAHTDILKVTEL